MHDLVRAWARREAERTLGAVQVREAERRILGYQVWTADAMDRTLLPQRGRPALSSALPKPLSTPRFSEVAEALAWTDAALPAIVEGMSRALRVGDIHCAAVLPHIMLSYLNLRKPWPQWLALCRIGLAAAAELGDPSTTANLHIEAGIAHRETHSLESAPPPLGRRWGESKRWWAEPTSRRPSTGPPCWFSTRREIASVRRPLGRLGQLVMATGRPAQAAEQLREAATVLPELNDPATEEAVRLLREAELAV